MKKIKGIADSMGLNVSKFAEITGYSRQELYLIIAGKRKARKDKFNEAVSRIKKYSEEMYKNDIEKAMREKELREKLISEFEAKGV